MPPSRKPVITEEQIDKTILDLMNGESEIPKGTVLALMLLWDTVEPMPEDEDDK